MSSWGGVAASFVRGLFRAVLSIFMPVILIVLGAGVFVVGARYDYSLVANAGIVLIAAGIGLGAAIYTGVFDD